jgi:hypothetical protein
MFTRREIVSLGEPPTDAIAKAEIIAIYPSGYGVNIVFNHPHGFSAVSYSRSVGSNILYDAEAKGLELISDEMHLARLNARKTPEEQSTLHYEGINKVEREIALI